MLLLSALSPDLLEGSRGIQFPVAARYQIALEVIATPEHCGHFEPRFDQQSLVLAKIATPLGSPYSYETVDFGLRLRVVLGSEKSSCCIS
jgi:hypothetical protein